MTGDVLIANKRKKERKGFPGTVSFSQITKKQHHARGASPVIRPFAKASLTIEAAFVLPLFLIASIMVISMIDMMNLYVKKENQIHSLAKDCYVASVLGSSSLTNLEGDLFRLRIPYVFSLPIKGIVFKKFMLENHCCIHVFNGFNAVYGDQIEKTKEYVYLSKSGDAYHRQRSCKYLNVSIQSVSGKVVGKMRSEDRSKYYACPYCAKRMTKKQLMNETVYITDYGNRYHSMATCRELRRMISVVPIDDIPPDRHPCSNCGGK